MVPECFEIVSDAGVKDAAFVLRRACEYVGLRCRWANRFAQKCLTFPIGIWLEFPISWGEKKKKKKGI